jgi:large repetitive protein
MSTNVFSRLRALLPEPPVLIGRVIAHNDDDTSTVELPIGVGLFSYVEGLAAGSLVRPRGTTVAVGLNAFIRNGVVESQAPDGVPLEIEIGETVACAYTEQSTVPVPPQAATVGASYSLTLAAYFGGGFAPYVHTLTAGAWPAGVVLDADTGIAAGTPSGAEVAAGLVVTRTDTTGRSVSTDAFTVTVSA